MNKKRLIATLVLLNDIVVQSIQFKRYLPLGKISVFLENLDRWGVDEIIILDINRSKFNIEPNFKLFEKIEKFKLKTPIIYGGNIRNKQDAINLIRYGADRIILGRNFFYKTSKIEEITQALGQQALIFSLPIIKKKNLFFYDHCSKKLICLKNFFIDKNLVSEIFITDVKHEGIQKGFDSNILRLYNQDNIPKIIFGGISSSYQIKKLLNFKNINAFAVGNFLSYKEHAFQNFLEHLPKNRFRLPTYKKI